MKKSVFPDDHELSSPIHRNEERFTAEDAVDESRAPVKSKARLDRLAALASTINNWEDDLSHPTLVKPVESKAEKIQAKLNEQVKSGYEPQPGTSGCSKWKTILGPNRKSAESSTKPFKWDKSVLDNLVNLIFFFFLLKNHWMFVVMQFLSTTRSS